MMTAGVLEWDPGGGVSLVLNGMDSEGTMEKNVSQDYINTICELYNDIYDDRVENTCPPTAGSSPCIPGEDWAPGQRAEHKSLFSLSAGIAGEGDISVHIRDQEDPYHRRLLDNSA